MNLRAILLLAAVLSFPAWQVMLSGRADPDQAGQRVLLAVVLAVGIERLVRLFVTATRPRDDTKSSQSTEGDPREDQ